MNEPTSAVGARAIVCSRRADRREGEERCMRSLHLLVISTVALSMPVTATGQDPPRAVLLVREVYSFGGQLLVIEETTTKSTTRRQYATPRESAEPPMVYRSAPAILAPEPAPVYRATATTTFRAAPVTQANPTMPGTTVPVAVVPNMSSPVGIATGPTITNVNIADRLGVIRGPCANGRCVNMPRPIPNDRTTIIGVGRVVRD